MPIRPLASLQFPQLELSRYGLKSTDKADTFCQEQEPNLESVISAIFAPAAWNSVPSESYKLDDVTETSRLHSN